MPRKGCPARRKQTVDARFGDAQVSSVISKIMWDGKKTVAEKIVYGAMEHAAKRLKSEPLVVLHKALEIVKPLVEVKSRRVGGATYQVPIEVSEARQRSLAVRWLVNYARGRSEFTMEEKLGNEIADAVQERGNAFKKREDTHRMAEANKAFSHYRW